MELASWVAKDVALPGTGGSTLLCNYSRSTATYLIDNVPNVIVSVKQATVKQPKVSISATDPSASETAGDPGQFLITLNAPSARTIAVKLETSGKAQRNKDYISLPRSVRIPAGSTSAVVNLQPIDDTAFEGVEDVKVKVVGGGNSYKASGRKATVFINSNE